MAVLAGGHGKQICIQNKDDPLAPRMEGVQRDRPDPRARRLVSWTLSGGDGQVYFGGGQSMMWHSGKAFLSAPVAILFMSPLRSFTGPGKSLADVHRACRFVTENSRALWLRIDTGHRYSSLASFCSVCLHISSSDLSACLQVCRGEPAVNRAHLFPPLTKSSWGLRCGMREGWRLTGISRLGG